MVRTIATRRRHHLLASTMNAMGAYATPIAAASVCTALIPIGRVARRDETDEALLADVDPALSGIVFLLSRGDGITALIPLRVRCITERVIVEKGTVPRQSPLCRRSHVRGKGSRVCGRGATAGDMAFTAALSRVH
jgi:hypothetical protein